MMSHVALLKKSDATLRGKGEEKKKNRHSTIARKEKAPSLDRHSPIAPKGMPRKKRRLKRVRYAARL